MRINNQFYNLCFKFLLDSQGEVKYLVKLETGSSQMWYSPEMQIFQLSLFKWYLGVEHVRIIKVRNSGWKVCRAYRSDLSDTLTCIYIPWHCQSQRASFLLHLISYAPSCQNQASRLEHIQMLMWSRRHHGHRDEAQWERSSHQGICSL